MKEHNFRCVNETHRKTDQGEEWRYKFKCTDEEDTNKFEIQIWTDDPLAMSEDTGFPREKGDAITISTGKKETRGRLGK